MKRVFALTFVALCLAPTSSRADGGQVAAGVAGGLLGGMLLGGALSAPRPYYAPQPAYIDPEPVYVRRCYWTQGEPYWDDWQGRWRRSRVRVCN